MGSDCGNARIDGLARLGRYQSVWSRLLFRYPELRVWADHIIEARRDGRIGREICTRYPSLASSPDGPQEQDWDTLALAAIDVVIRGRRVLMRRSDLGHEGEYVPDRAREAFWDTDSLGTRTLGVVLTEHSWAPVSEVIPAR